MNIIMMFLGLVVGAFLGFVLHKERPRSVFSTTCSAAITALLGWFIIEHPFRWMALDAEINTGGEIIRTIVFLIVLLVAYYYVVARCFNHGTELGYSPKVRQIARRTGKDLAQISEEQAKAKLRQAEQEKYNAQLAEACRISGIGIEIIDLDEDPEGLNRDVLAVPKLNPAEEQALMARAHAKALQKRAEAAAMQEAAQIEAKSEREELKNFMKTKLLAGVMPENLEAARAALTDEVLDFLTSRNLAANVGFIFEEGKARVKIINAVFHKKAAM